MAPAGVGFPLGAKVGDDLLKRGLELVLRAWPDGQYRHAAWAEIAKVTLLLPLGADVRHGLHERGLADGGPGGREDVGKGPDVDPRVGRVLAVVEPARRLSWQS